MDFKKVVDIDEIEEKLKKIPEKKVLVLGDLILDHYVFGEVERISPEAPVPIVEVKEEKYFLGGAGNVSLNIKRFGGNVFLISFRGEDANGKFLINLLKKEKIENFLIKREVPTIIKTRIIGKTQQIVRIDREKIEELKEKEKKTIMRFIIEKCKNFDIIIVSDYGKGFICKEIIETLKKLNIKIVVDPKPEHFKLYRNLFCLTPNKNEACLGSGKIKVKFLRELIEVGDIIIKKLKCENLIITLGKDGMLIFEDRKKIFHISSVAKEVFDVTGAGDTVCGIFSLYYTVSNSILESSIVSNIAGGIVVGKLGTATTSREELIEFLKKNYNNILIEKIR